MFNTPTNKKTDPKHNYDKHETERRYNATKKTDTIGKLIDFNRTGPVKKKIIVVKKKVKKIDDKGNEIEVSEEEEVEVDDDDDDE